MSKLEIYIENELSKLKDFIEEHPTLKYSYTTIRDYWDTALISASAISLANYDIVRVTNNSVDFMDYAPLTLMFGLAFGCYNEREDSERVGDRFCRNGYTGIASYLIGGTGEISTSILIMNKSIGFLALCAAGFMEYCRLFKSDKVIN